MTTLFIDKRNLQLKVDSKALIFYDSNTADMYSWRFTAVSFRIG